MVIELLPDESNILRGAARSSVCHLPIRSGPGLTKESPLENGAGGVAGGGGCVAWGGDKF